MAPASPAARPLRVLYLIGSFRNGGAEKSLTQVLTNLDRERFSPHAACFVAGGSYYPQVRALGIPFHVLNVRSPLFHPLNVLPLARLVRLIRRYRIDVIHGYLVSANILAVLAARLTRTPVICGLRSIDSLKSRRLMAAHLWALRHASAITAVSGAARTAYTERGIDADRVTVLENGVDIPTSPPARDASRERFGLDDSRLVVTTVATLVPEKDHMSLIEAADALRERFPELLFLFGGAGKLEAEIRAEIRRRGLEESVRLLGHVEDVGDLLNASDLFCLPSVVEGMSNALLEAMAWGVPAVVTNVGANPHLVRDGESGIVVQAGDARALAEAIADLAGDAGRRELYGRRLRQRAIDDFSVDVMIRRLQDYYDKLGLVTD